MAGLDPRKHVSGRRDLLSAPGDRRALARIVRAVAGACLITGVELLFGLVVNRMLGLRVWDYSGLPGSLMGQICLPYFFLWIWVAWLAMGLHGLLWRRLFPEADDLSR